jgi:hypothetical protein
MLRADMQRHAGKPAFLNSYLKHDTLDGGLSDAAAYIGPAGQLVKAGISSVLCTMARDAAAGGPQASAAVRAEANAPAAWKAATRAPSPTRCSSPS